MDTCLVMCTSVVIGSVVFIGWLIKNRKKPSTKRNPWSRQLDSGEQILYMLGSKGLLLICDALFFATSQPLSRDIIRDALTRLGMRHPLFRMRITEEQDGRCMFREMDSYEADITESDSNDWVEEFEHQLKTTFDTKQGPLWRAVIMQHVSDVYSTNSHPHQTVILLSVHHSICDGSSLTRLIVNQLIDDMESIHHGDISVPESQPLPPSSTQCIQIKLSVTEMMIATCLSYLCRIPSIKRFLMRRLTSSFPQNPWTAVKGEVSDVRPDCEKTTSVIPFQLDVGFTEKLMAKCKFEGVTLHAAFQVATMAAMSDFLGSSPNTQWTAMTTIDMRRLFPDQLTAQHVVQCLGGVEVTHRLPLEWKENFWQCAREVGQTLRCNMHAAVLQNMKTSEIAVKCNISLEDFVKCSQNGSRNHCYMSINNMGNCNFLNRHDQNVVHLKARFGGSSEHEFGPTMASSVTTLQQRINWSLLYFKNVTTKEEAQNVAQGIREALHLASAHL